jgi:hypothetical protein
MCILGIICLIFFLDFPIYLQSVYIHSNTISKLCVGKRGRVEECSVAPLRDKRVKTLCGICLMGSSNRLSHTELLYHRMELDTNYECVPLVIKLQMEASVHEGYITLIWPFSLFYYFKVFCTKLWIK